MPYNKRLQSLDRNYPGEFLDRLLCADAYPIPQKVGEYTSSLTNFLSLSQSPSQWVHFKERAGLVLKGEYDQITPVHFDGTFTLACNLMCPHCTARTARTQWVKDKTWKRNHAISKDNTMPFENIITAIDQISDFIMDDYVGISWNGGEPSIIPWIYECVAHATRKGISSCFISNGVELDAEKIVEAGPSIIRVSLNCGTPEAYAGFHGCKKELGNFEKVVATIEKISEIKFGSKSDFLFGISLIVDERNIESLPRAIAIITSIQRRYAESVDNIIVRPVMRFSHLRKNFGKHKENTIRKLRSLMTIGSQLHEKCRQVGILLIARTDWYEESPAADQYDGYNCLSHGWFSQIQYNGDIQLCSETFCDPKFTIGNIFKKNLPEIWCDTLRRQTLRRVNAERCLMNKCQHTSRGHQLNRIFNQIEAFRKEGKIDRVEKWVADLRKLTIPPTHSFFL